MNTSVERICKIADNRVYYIACTPESCFDEKQSVDVANHYRWEAVFKATLTLRMEDQKVAVIRFWWSTDPKIYDERLPHTFVSIGSDLESRTLQTPKMDIMEGIGTGFFHGYFCFQAIELPKVTPLAILKLSANEISYRTFRPACRDTPSWWKRPVIQYMHIKTQQRDASRNADDEEKNSTK